MKKHVFVTRKIPMDGLRIIKQEFHASVWENEMPPSKEQIIENGKDCEGIVTLLSDPISADIIERLPNLRVIAQYAVGYDNIDLKYATKRGIIVTNTPGVLTETTADLTWALIMAASRRIVEADRYVRRGNWRVAWGPELLLGSDIHGATLGIIGLGRIGAAVARRACGFDMKILYSSRSTRESDKSLPENLGAQRVDMDTLLRESDVVTLHVPLTPETRHLIGKVELAKMKPSAILVNTSRGPVVDEEALYQALRSKRLAAAGLDVFAEEPIRLDSPLLELENVVLLPHIGSASTRTRSTMAKMCAENLRAALSGARPPNIVNPEVL
ncbi:MAG: D-glycerate dehydrogenase [Candidatus Thorarchaeota archaeon]|nr:MAG: D-glycerate dehydrogenase [Candidatus Thorarchaeota archaeon]